jgi:hypothetical protein
MKLKRWLALVLFLTLSVASSGPARSQSPNPPNQWHPYRGGRNCIQVADANGNFNCAGGTTVDPATGNMVISGTISFSGSGGFSATYFPGLVVGPVGTSAQILGSNDFVIGTTATTTAPSGPLIKGVVFRVRQGPAGSCQVVVSGGNSFNQEFIIPVVAKATNGFLNAMGQDVPQLFLTFPGGPAGC